MENNQKQEVFQYKYSAKEQEELQKIREKYIQKEENPMDKLRRLDESVYKKAAMWSIILGTIGALIMGTGMSLIMTDWGRVLGIRDNLTMVTGILIGVIGLLLVGAAYPVYHRVLKKEREKIAPEILRMTEELMK